MDHAEIFAACGMCRFHLAETRECRKRAPAIAADSGAGIWPLVARFDWCGEYRRDPERPALVKDPQ